ncbi:malto-oligosyltrehalose synthase [Leptolyngbya sp. 'hensonii']|uniref:malto-oligosyltrehalose synthase n=1 Tax=Leptolyngbya sp. 'hensonii' TaxID=1922337 RepID=UPI00094F9A77|nr:malto-oligosyltrehalose synthase [Leptolyngbya sp. 'hensonii']OLP16760.1 malto-oligosyltrehalose synthase [Leptolyngbya sp. 'hensonii']
MRIPTTTYRLQFNSQFGFADAAAIVPYLDSLGISDLYASPIFQARKGSTHGYDVVDPNQLNPDLGTVEEFEALVGQLQVRGMGWLQDIVPNHMAYDSANRYLMDVLENGPESEYVGYFDLSWNSPFDDRQDRILTPLLGNFYGSCLEHGEIQLHYDQNGLSVNYYDLKLPIRLESYTRFLTYNLGKLNRELGRNHPDFIRLLGIIYLLKNISPELTGKQRPDQLAFVKGLLWEAYTSNVAVTEFIDENIKVFNGEVGNPESFNLLDSLLADQFYRLAFWKVGAEEMNYRRFFTVNELIAVRVEDPKVFKTGHQLIGQMVESGHFTGLRIDHIDGLYNPAQYLKWLREKMGDVYITVEKILELQEDLPQDWQIQGTSGYEFLNYVNGIFCCQDNQSQLDEIYRYFTGREKPYEQLVKENKHLIIDKNLSGDIDNLAFILKNISRKYRYGNDFTMNGLRQAIAEVLALFPVYRTYIDEGEMSEIDRTRIQEVITAAKANLPLIQNELNFIEKLMLLEFDDSLTQTEKERWLHFVMRVQQYTGPLMAKGVEDTTLYVYNRLLSLNEVGGNPDHFGIALADFHAFNQHRQTHWPHTMNATATHDTKRGEDMRARINVLSEIPTEWEEQVRIWREINRDHRRSRRGRAIPDANDEYFFYQTVVGAYPFPGAEMDFVDRVQAYLIKAIREAKVHTAWLRPDLDYESACAGFVEKVLDPTEPNPFLEKFLPFQQRIAYYGMFNSLAQTLLKLTAPGIPDFYQGTELWELSLVDPDNRRPVDFQQRQSYLDEIQAKIHADLPGLLTELLAHKTDGRIKLFLIRQVLKARNQYLELFRQGSYRPLEAEGTCCDHVIAFARAHDRQMAIAVVPRFLTTLIQPREDPIGEGPWQDTLLPLPENAPTTWTNALTGEALQTSGAMLVGQALRCFPVGLWIGHS